MTAPLQPKDLALIVPGTPFFSDLIHRIAEDHELPATRRRDLASGLRRVAKALGLSPENVPCDARWLQPRLATINPIAVGLTAKSWTNAVSDARSAMARFDRLKPRANRRKQLLPEWRALWDQLEQSGEVGTRAGLSSFMFFLSARGIAPEAVTSQYAVDFRDALAESEIRKEPEAIYRKAVANWNRAAERLDFWPKQGLTAPSRLVRVRLPLDEHQPSFLADLDRYLGGLAKPDPFDENAPARALRPASIEGLRNQLLHFAGAVVRSGVPASRLVGLRDLLAPDVLRVGLTWLHEKAGNEVTVGLENAASALSGLARRIGLSEAELRTVLTLLKRIDQPRQQGMTNRNREWLRPLQDRSNMQALLELPQRLMDRAETTTNPLRAASLREDAIALAILIYCPIRRKNLVGIRISQHIKRPGDGRVYLDFAEGEVKNRRTQAFELPPHVVAMIDRHLATRSPALCPCGVDYLFPRRDGSGPTGGPTVSTRLVRVTERELGFPINPHLFRHSAATLYLSVHPGQYEVVRGVLGHARTSSTIAVYAGFEPETAARLYADVLAEISAR